jgi:tetratricopeptide (TPR) repeat protein
MKRTERRHLKENEIVHTIEVVRDFVEARKRTIVASVAALALVAAVIVGLVVVRQRNESRGVELLADAMVALNAPVVPAGVAGTGDDLPASASLGATGSFATEEAKLTAALPKLQAAADAHPESKAGITARYHLGGALAALGRHEEAIAAFDDVVRRGGPASLYGRMARLGKADTQARAGQLEAAIATWTEIADGDTDEFPIDAVLMELARAYVRKGDVGEARRTLTRIVDQHPDSPYTPEARSELDNLEG